MTSDVLNKVMMVEDDQDIQTVAQLALETVGGLSVEIFSSGKEAIENVEQINPDLILLDVMMPEMDGPSTLKELQKIDTVSKIPVIFMTAKAQSHEVENYKALGAIDVITKPFDPMSLASDIKEIWGKHNG